MIDFDKLDKTIHESSRLEIMTLLAARLEWSFADLKQDLGMTDGNLITHLRKLVAAGYAEMNKEPQPEGRPMTKCTLTEAGRVAFAEYLKVLEQIVKSAK
ncbi:MAG: putative ArsR family transcriptional regulator [Verrucomicrobiales bacterium]|jgi:predicted ArsR family transcriptional regulator